MCTIFTMFHNRPYPILFGYDARKHVTILKTQVYLMLCSSCAKISISYKRRDKVFLLSYPHQNSETSFTLNLNHLKENRKFWGVNFYQCQSFLEKIQECLLWFSFFLAMICLGCTSISI